ncbi:outer membrane lipoprotein-sorting protein [Rhodopseudomonas thermotolerans]|uniref:Outer membrane lipoprotein-sorting protein n=2 Tax=Rhodopseudomonas TaxID=1073 RepID=A0A336JUA9_9BRAD|nr:MULTISPECIES: outer membrane lipoprotein carrier protein LolA [Rhodopseudomonas]RED25843.1 outer membrane lipoprotein-sorting protein [Rhodopseudomonas pentothenatexigens]REF90977.1 outer membrane lipoprotein-sorting protein [Rhodopseudomonas thermotolerans]SSW93062.1 outer membrane lipoprotein-sorting protein [Rhodopseudomonas pentothenatexigens]
MRGAGAGSRNRHSAPVAADGPRGDVAGAVQDMSLIRQFNDLTASRATETGLWQLCVAAAAAAFVGTTALPAKAEPAPAAKPSTRALQLSAAEPKQRAPQAPQQQPVARLTTPPEPVIPDPRRNVPASIFTTFDAAQKAEAAKVSAYLSSLQTLVGQFVQVGPDGSKLTGDFYIMKPGKVRFEYDEPSPVSMIADGQSVVVRDRKLATQDVYPLSQTPLRYLLSDRIDLLRDTNVVSITSDDLYSNIIIEEKNAIIGTSRLLLMFGAKDGQLKQWTVTDPQGYDTTVAVYNLDTTKRPDPSMFKIDYTNYQTPPG